MRNLTLIFVVLFSFACNNSDKAYLMNAPEANFEDILEVPLTEQASERGETSGSEEITKKIIKTGSIEFQSKNIEADYKKIVAIVASSGAYIESEDQARNYDRIYYNLTIRVPADNYDTLFSTIMQVGSRLDRKSSNIQDVTERYYDIKTQIKNKKALEERYLNLLQKAVTMRDILEIEQKLNEVRIEIENLEGQFRYLNKRINYSSINVSFYQELPYSLDSRQKKGFGVQLTDALSWGWQGFLVFIIGITSIWPFILIAGGVIYGLRWFIKKRKLKNQR